MKKILVSLAVVWCVALGVQAQDNQEYEKQVAKMLEMTHTMDAMKQIFPQMTAMLKQQLPQAPDEFWKELDASMNGMYDKMIKAVIPVYKKYLTLDDLKEIIKFYETPVGKKLSEMNPKATAEILPIAQQIGMQTMQELMQKHYEQLARATITNKSKIRLVGISVPCRDIHGYRADWRDFRFRILSYLLKLISVFKECTDRSVVGLFTAEWAFLSLIARFLF